MTDSARASSLTVTLDVDEPKDLLERHYPNGKLGGLTIEGKAPSALGQHVTLQVRVKRPAREFSLPGQLAWARRKASKHLIESFGVDFLPTADAKRVRLLAFARNELPETVTRFEPRVQVELPVRVVHGGRSRSDFLADLSPSGAFVRTWDPLDADSIVQLMVRLPRTILALELNGRVAWQRSIGTDPGMGIEFQDVHPNTKERVKRLLDRLLETSL